MHVELLERSSTATIYDHQPCTPNAKRAALLLAACGSIVDRGVDPIAKRATL
jgi:hypothetical protein